MDRIDVLGDQRDRFGVFTKELLAETNDIELQEIVKKAANELSSPMALVSLVLDQIQFFKAFIGLPPVLAASRGTHRDASFCQFVVRDGKTFEVNDAPNDPRIPQHVVNEYNIHAYLGVPIMVNKIVVGSLCVLDTKKRGFSKEEHQSLSELAAKVNERLEVISNNRKKTRLALTEKTLDPGLTELSNSLKPIHNFLKLGYSTTTSIRSFLNHSKHSISDKGQYSNAIRLSLEAAITANNLNENLLLEIEMAVMDGEDCVDALEQLVLKPGSTRLSRIIIAAQDLTRNATKLIGGFVLPDYSTFDPIIYTTGNLAIAVVTNCILTISSELEKLNSKNGIQLNLIEHNEYVELLFLAEDLADENRATVINQLNQLTGDEQPTVSVDSSGLTLRLILKTLDIKPDNNS